MNSSYNRPLYNFELVEHFLSNVLDIDVTSDESYDIISKIVSTELNIENFDESLITLTSRTFRKKSVRDDRNRKSLREQIMLELLQFKRIDNDDEISLGNGGAFPKTEIYTTSDAYIIIGLPASGKSTIANQIADFFGAFILDSDYAKRKLPEFKSLPFGATLVHEESDRIIFGYNNPKQFKSLFDASLEIRANIVLPKIGSSSTNILELVHLLRKCEYNVHLTLVSLDRKKSTERALSRFVKSDRYVPLSLIFDTYGNSPTQTFYELFTFQRDIITSFGIISTDVAPGEKPIAKLCTENNPAILFT